MALEIATQFIETLGDVMSVIAPNAGGSIPDENSEEWLQWRLAIQMKYEEASRRGFWRRLLTHEDLDLREGDLTVDLPIRFQRANSLYIFAVDEVDLADPDRIPDGQSAVPQLINDPEDDAFGTWQLILNTAIEADTTAIFWYFATPPKPMAATDKLLLPGDMIAFGAMSEIFRSKNLPGSQDDARNEFENRITNYLALETIPARNEILQFKTNPRGLDRTRLARQQWTGGRGTRQGRT